MNRKPSESCPIGFQAGDKDVGALYELLGPTKFRLLQKFFGGRRVWIPKDAGEPRCGACAARDRCIQLWHREGRPVAEIAERLGLSPKSVYRIIGGIRRKPARDR